MASDLVTRSQVRVNRLGEEGQLMLIEVLILGVFLIVHLQKMEWV